MKLHWLWRVAINWLVIAVALTSVTRYPVLAPLALLIVGTRQLALAQLAHDGAHRNALPGKWNDALTNLLTLLPISAEVRGYREFHFAHHRHLGTTLDPERQLWAHYPDRWVPNLNKPRRMLLDLCGLGLPEMLLTLRFITKFDVRGVLLPVLFQATFVGCFVLNGWYVALAVWQLSFLTTFWALFRARTWTEHFGTDGGTQRHAKPALWKRSLYMPELAWLHYEHHIQPAVPVWMFV